MHKQSRTKLGIVALVVLGVGISLGAVMQDNGDGQVGRYQLVEGYSTVLVLDTATGQCWKQARDDFWRDLGNPARGRQPAPVEREPLGLNLPQGRVDLTVRQREVQALPGSEDRLFLRLGDITAGQVLLQLQDDQGEAILRERSVRERDLVEFEVADRTYYLQVRRLVDIPLGSSDFAEFVISETIPQAEPPAPPEKGEVQPDE